VLRLGALDARVDGAAGALTSRLVGLEERLAPLEVEHAAVAVQRVLDAAAQRALDERHPRVRYVTLRAADITVQQLAVS
jgi:hypothetical protein